MRLQLVERCRSQTSAFGRKLPVGSYRDEYLRSQEFWSSNLSFTATFSKRKPLIFLEKVGGLWFLASEKRPYGTGMGLRRYFGPQNRGQ